MNESIAVRDAQSGAAERSDANDGSTNDPDDGRRERILAESQKGEKLGAPAIAARLGCAARTNKRELDALRGEGLIEFAGPSKTGFYQIRQ